MAKKPGFPMKPMKGMPPKDMPAWPPKGKKKK